MQVRRLRSCDLFFECPHPHDPQASKLQLFHLYEPPGGRIRSRLTYNFALAPVIDK